MATNLEVGEYRNIDRGRDLRRATLNFMFVPSRNKHAVAKCCAQLGQVDGQVR